MFYADAGANVAVIDGDVPARSEIASADDLPHRRSTPQDRHSHVLLARGRDVLATRAAGVLDALRAAGGLERPMPDQTHVVGVMCRRTLLDRVMRDHVGELPHVHLHDGEATGLVLDGPCRRITGVATDTTTFTADLVIDATGRRAPVRGWLREKGIAMPEPITVPCGTVYLTAFFRLRQWPSAPLNRGYAAGGFGEAGACLAFPTDNGFMSVTIGLLPGHPLIRPLLHIERFTSAARLHPLVEPWLDPANARAVGRVALMSGLHNQLRPPPDVDGLVAVGDAACTTNPAYGRGMSLAILHAAATVDTIAPGSIHTQARAHDILNRDLRQWFDDSVAQDQLRTARWSGAPLPDDPIALAVEAAQLRAPQEPDVQRALFRRFNLIDPPQAITAVQPPPTADRSRPAWTPGPSPSLLARVASSAA
jgi:flavin-dependent dehydrogenase